MCTTVDHLGMACLGVSRNALFWNFHVYSVIESNQISTVYHWEFCSYIAWWVSLKHAVIKFI